MLTAAGATCDRCLWGPPAKQGIWICVLGWAFCHLIERAQARCVLVARTARQLWHVLIGSLTITYEIWIVAGIFGLQNTKESCVTMQKMMHARPLVSCTVRDLYTKTDKLRDAMCKLYKLWILTCECTRPTLNAKHAWLWLVTLHAQVGCRSRVTESQLLAWLIEFATCANVWIHAKRNTAQHTQASTTLACASLILLPKLTHVPLVCPEFQP